MPEIASKLFFAALALSDLKCLCLSIAEAHFLDRLSIVICCSVQGSIQNVQIRSITLFLRRNQWMIERLRQEKSQAFAPLPQKPMNNWKIELSNVLNNNQKIEPSQGKLGKVGLEHINIIWLVSILVSSTDLKKIQTQHTLFRKSGKI